nr:MAG TPA: hypothetical protein [Caudoviricetes sp.]
MIATIPGLNTISSKGSGTGTGLGWCLFHECCFSATVDNCLPPFY